MADTKIKKKIRKKDLQKAIKRRLKVNKRMLKSDLDAISETSLHHIQGRIQSYETVLHLIKNDYMRTG